LADAGCRVSDRPAVLLSAGRPRAASNIKEYPIEQLFRDARLLRIYEGTSRIQQLIVAWESLRDRRA
jgi:alkylation response protein AidB-like acyl-CoA dehydrogenase